MKPVAELYVGEGGTERLGAIVDDAMRCTGCSEKARVLSAGMTLHCKAKWSSLYLLRSGTTLHYDEWDA